jgi:seryl-tRNA synthetase
MNPEEVGDESAVSSVSVQTPHASVGATENVDRIREILFGSQMREYGQRFSQLEERLLRETSELKTEVRRRLDSLEAYTRQEVDALSDRLKTERNERTQTVDRVFREATDATRALERRLNQSDEQVSKDLRELRQLMLERHRTLSDELTQCVSKSELLQNRRLEELRANAVDRIALASLLAEVALRIRGESLVPGVEDTLSAGAGR